MVSDYFVFFAFEVIIVLQILLKEAIHLEPLQVGDKVTAIYKTGKYIGEITDFRSEHYLVKFLAVFKHPLQGDLHHPKDVNVAFFHERKALSYLEQANIPKKMVKPFEMKSRIMKLH